MLRFGPYMAWTDRHIGRGNFGTVLQGEHCQSAEPVAVKVEPEGRRQRLPTESSVYQALTGCPGFPRMRWFGRAHGRLALVLDLLGPSLKTIHHRAGMGLGVCALQHVGEQALRRLETLHQFGWLHCDVKPGNLLLPAAQRRTSSPVASRDDRSAARRARGQWDGGCDDGWIRRTPRADIDVTRPISLIDFGLSRRWRDAATGKHMRADACARRRAGAPVGTGRFASLNNHSGGALSRRDDLEALAFSLIYLRMGRLPWSGLKPPPASKEERFAAMLDSKRSVGVAEMSRGLPDGFELFLGAIRQLEFEEPPQYCVLVQMIRSWRD